MSAEGLYQQYTAQGRPPTKRALIEFALQSAESDNASSWEFTDWLETSFMHGKPDHAPATVHDLRELSQTLRFVFKRHREGDHPMRSPLEAFLSGSSANGLNGDLP